MSSFWGNSLKLNLFGESHGKCVGGTLDNFPSGILVDFEKINFILSLRKGGKNFTTPREEQDKPIILSGITNGYTNGSPITVIFDNNNFENSKYSDFRPSHGDFTYFVKHKGFADLNGGGHYSGRLTLPLVFFGALASLFVESKNIKVFSHIKSIGNIIDLDIENVSLGTLNKLNSSHFPVIDDNIAELMLNRIEAIKEEGDSIGGRVESVILNLPIGYGSPIFDNLESKFASMLFSIPSVKGVEFGLGFDFDGKLGSDVQDKVIANEQKVINNYNGGIFAGISNGNPIKIKCVLKPTPTLTKNFGGKNDPCILPRGTIAINYAIYLVLADILIGGN